MTRQTYDALCALAEQHGVVMTEQVRAFVRAVEQADAETHREAGPTAMWTEIGLAIGAPVVEQQTGPAGDAFVLDLTEDDRSMIRRALRAYGHGCADVASRMAQKDTTHPSRRPVMPGDIDMAIKEGKRAFELVAMFKEPGQ